MFQVLKKAVAALAAMLIGVGAFAQVTTSGLSGRITDENGEPVIGAVIRAVHTQSGTQYAAVANNDGRFVIDGMRAGGPYTVELSCLGYQTVQYTDVTLQLAETYNLNSSMKEDKDMLSEAVVVSEKASKFAVEKTGAATNITSEQIENIPTISRSITDIAKLSPYGGNGMSFAGSDGRTANFTVDGANFNNNFGLNDGLPGGGNPISIDALQEIQVVISPYDVRQTNFIGGGVNAITKSGTNTFKGTAYVYHRNENMRGDAVDGAQIAGARDKDRTTTYGATLGGPIIKNKLFFFVNYEYTKVPTVANRWRASEDGKMDADNYISRTTLADMEKVSNYVKEKYGYDTGSWTSFPADEYNQKILARLDWNITSNHHLALRYNYTLNNRWSATNASSSDAKQRAVYARFSQYSMAFANSMYSQENRVHSASLDLNSRITDKISNQLLATFSKLDDVRGTNSSKFPFIDILDGSGKYRPYMALGHELFTHNNAVHNTVWNIKDDVTMNFGDHKIVAGVSYENQLADNIYMRNGTGYYRYNSLEDFLNQAEPETVCLTYGYDGEYAPAARVRFHKAAIYAQDDWAINEKFKLTYGLRLEGIFFNNDDLMTNKAIKDLDYGGRHIDTGTWPSGKITVSPRVGFNWDVLGDKTLKVRGGTGLFSGRLPLVFFTNMPTNSGMVQQNAKIQAGDPNLAAFKGNFIADLDELKKKFISLGYPETIRPEDGTVNGNIQAVDKKFKMPQVWKTSVAVDYFFKTSFPMSISVEGIFNKTVNAARISNWNTLPVDGFARFTGVDNRAIYPANYTYNKYQAFVLTNTGKGYGWSANLQFNIQPVKGLDITASYTHVVSKELTGMPGSDASSAFTYIPTVDGPNNTKLHNSQYVTPDRVFVNLTYKDNCHNTFGLFYETWRGGYNYSYMTDGDMNGDSYNYDVIYIPKNKTELNEMAFKTADDRDRFWAYVNKDKYLSKNKGSYAEAYSVYSPWVHRLDFHFAHDFKVRAGKTTNTLQLSFDIKNLMNLFNSSWGVSKYMNSDLNSGRILTYEGYNAEGKPIFSTPKAVNGNTKTWTYNHALGQCWYAQIGIKYIFN